MENSNPCLNCEYFRFGKTLPPLEGGGLRIPKRAGHAPFVNFGVRVQKLFHLRKGVYKVPYSPLEEGGVYKSVWEEYQVVKRRREYHGCWEEYNMETRERGSNIILPII